MKSFSRIMRKEQKISIYFLLKNWMNEANVQKFCFNRIYFWKAHKKLSFKRETFNAKQKNMLYYEPEGAQNCVFCFKTFKLKTNYIEKWYTIPSIVVSSKIAKRIKKMWKFDRTKGKS